MDGEAKTLSSRVRFWTLIGPFTLLLTFFVSIVKASPQSLYLELVVVLAIPICWQWRMRGLVVSLLALGILFFVFFGSIDPEELWWQSGYAFALAVGLAVTYLGFEEASHVIVNVPEKPAEPFLTSQEPFEELKEAQNEWEKERAYFNTQQFKLKQEIELRDVKIRSLENSVLSLQPQMQTERELEFSELVDKLQGHIAQREAALSEQEKTLREVQGELWSVKEREKQQSEEYLRDWMAQIETAQESAREWKTKEAQARELILEKEANENELTATLLRTKREIEKVQHSAKLLEEEKNRLYVLWQHESEELERLKNQMEAESERKQSQEDTEGLLRELDSLRDVAALYKQLKRQFEEKSKVLSQTRAELFQLEVKYLAMQKEWEDGQLEPDPLLEKAISDYCSIEDECVQKDSELETLEELISSLMGGSVPRKAPRKKKAS